MRKDFLIILFFLVISFVAKAQGNIVTFCPGNTRTLEASPISSPFYIWEVKKVGGSFGPLYDGVGTTSTVSGSNTATLTLSNLASLESGTQYRCIVGENYLGYYGPTYVLQARNVFNSTGMPTWETAANWSCGYPPDLTYGQDVIIAGGNNVLLKQSALLSGLTLMEDSKMSVAPGAVLVINPLFNGTTSGDYNLMYPEFELMDSIAAPLEDFNSLPPLIMPAVSQLGVVEKKTAAQLIDSFHRESVRLSAFKTKTKNIFGTNDLEPDQNGYAYSFGIKQITTRAKPKEGDYLHKMYALVGTDCSGFIAVVLQNIGVKLTDLDYFGVATIETKISKGLENSTIYKGVKLLTMPYDASKPLQNGDLIVWRGKKRHVGFYWDDGSIKRIYQSHGNPDPATEQSCKEFEFRIDSNTNDYFKDKYGDNQKFCKTRFTPEEEQAKNLGEKRGIHPLDFQTMLKYWDGPPNFILRFTDFEVNTYDVTNVKTTSADFTGAVSTTGNSEILQMGFVLSNDLRKEPTVLKSKKIVVPIQNPPIPQNGFVQNGANTFNGNDSSLIPGSVYNVRAYAINATDTAYGPSISFTAGGSLDTVGILQAHGDWKIYEGVIINLLENQREEAMGQAYSSYVNYGGCNNLLNEILRRDTMAYGFNADNSGYYKRRFYGESYTQDTTNCKSEFWFSNYDWESFDYTWKYDNASKTIKITFPPGTFGDGQYQDLVIESFSPTEIVVNAYNTSFGYPLPEGRLILR